MQAGKIGATAHDEALEVFKFKSRQEQRICMQ